MIGKLTFEKILAAYIALAAILAITLPYELKLEELLSISPSSIPFASWLSLAPHSLPFLPTYFLVLFALLPFVVIGLAFHPQPAYRAPYAIPSLERCAGATAITSIMVVLVLYSMFLDAPPSATAYRKARLAYYAAVSRLGLAFFGPLVMSSVALVAYIALAKLPRMWIGYRHNQFG